MRNSYPQLERLFERARLGVCRQPPRGPLCIRTTPDLLQMLGFNHDRYTACGYVLRWYW
jgi:hypothetical protein